METFAKLLVSKYSPQNKCYADDGDVLYLRPKRILGPPRLRHLRHHFTSTRDRKTRSRYGWVIEAAPLTLKEFVARFLPGWNPNALELEALLTMLRSIAHVAQDLPVAATYSPRGVENRTMELDVHRVIVYRDRG